MGPVDFDWLASSLRINFSRQQTRAAGGHASNNRNKTESGQSATPDEPLPDPLSDMQEQGKTFVKIPWGKSE